MPPTEHLDQLTPNGEMTAVDFHIATTLPPGTIRTDRKSKLTLLVQSRKFWTAVAAAAVTAFLYYRGELYGAELADAITLIAAIYIGSVALEDGLHNLINIWSNAE
ncbi:hypothetical protein LCGC14_0759830 [marine sediment metagenome]|uniref:Uncharacterized protein n=1 Tax=marine sediment metagenome TaxID=412755 RepID=A0A0F9T8M5_9ZZZZ